MTPNSVDRSARDRTRQAIRAYVRGEIRSFAFADGLFEIDTPDPAVRLAHEALWFYYDDLEELPLVCTAESQRTLRRLDLMLASDAIVTRAKGRHTMSRETASGASLWPFASFSGLRRVREATRIEPADRDVGRTDPAPGDRPVRRLLLPWSACGLVFVLMLWLIPHAALIGAAIVLLGFVAFAWSTRRSLDYFVAE